MLKVIFRVEYRNKETVKIGLYTCEKIVIDMTIANKVRDKYNRMGQIGPIEYVYSILGVEMVGYVANYNECIFNEDYA